MKSFFKKKNKWEGCVFWPTCHCMGWQLFTSSVCSYMEVKILTTSSSAEVKWCRELRNLKKQNKKPKPLILRHVPANLECTTNLSRKASFQTPGGSLKYHMHLNTYYKSWKPSKNKKDTLIIPMPDLSELYCLRTSSYNVRTAFLFFPKE